MNSVREVVEGPEFLQDLQIELGSLNAAREAIKDLLFGWPRTQDQWQLALDRSRPTINSSIANPNLKCLFVLPNNHSIAGIYPITLALCHGMNVTVRVPHEFADRSPLTTFVRHLTKEFPLLKTLSSSFRITRPTDVDDFDAVFVVGSTETGLSLGQMIGSKPIQVLGSLASVTYLEELSDQNLHPAVRDTLSLGQRGCLSSRLWIFRGHSDELLSVASRIDAIAHAFWNAPLPESVRVSQIEAEIDQRLLGHKVVHLCSSGNLLISIDKTQCRNPKDLARFIRANLASCPFMIPVVLVDRDFSPGSLNSTLGQGDFRLGTSKENTDISLPTFATGTGNVQIWDGNFAGTALFKFQRSATLDKRS